jgi:teichuronic acid biosynthesis glycosyltransferase TuaC
MRVLVVSDMYARPERAISAIFRHRQMVEVAALGVEVRVLCPLPVKPDRLWRGIRAAPVFGEIELDGIRINRVPYPQLLPFGPAATVGKRLLQRALYVHIQRLRETFDFDLIHGIRLFPMVSALAPIAAALERPLLGMAVGSDVHTHPFRSRGIRRLTRGAIERSDRIVAVSRALSESVTDLGQPGLPVSTVYNGVDAAMFSPDPAQKEALRASFGLPLGGVGLCFVGRLARTKGLWELLRAFRQVAAGRPGSWLVVVGDGPERAALEAWVDSEGLGSRVFLSGAQVHETIPRWLNASDVFVLPSYNEGLPNVVLEAMACGLPVLSTDVGGTSEAVVQGETGYLVDPGSADALVEPMEALLRDSGQRERLGRAGRRRAVEDFSWSRSAHDLLQLYDQLLDTCRARRRRRVAVSDPVVGRGLLPTDSASGLRGEP